MKYSNTPLPRIIDARDPISGRKLVLFSKKDKRYIPNRTIPSCRSGEEPLVENYDLAKNDDFKEWDLHHRLELTLDGQFANSAMDLINKDMYFHRPYFELIWLRHGEHSRLHNLGDKNPRGMLGRTGDKHPMYGRKGDKSPAWKGGIASDHNAYMRARKARKRAMSKLSSNL